jgi:hypothetical protein
MSLDNHLHNLLYNELTDDAYKYYLALVSESQKKITKQIKEILSSQEKRAIYTRSKTADNADEREAARQEYLEKSGIPHSFRWKQAHKFE